MLGRIFDDTVHYLVEDFVVVEKYQVLDARLPLVEVPNAQVVVITFHPRCALSHVWKLAKVLVNHIEQILPACDP